MIFKRSYLSKAKRKKYVKQAKTAAKAYAMARGGAFANSAAKQMGIKPNTAISKMIEEAAKGQKYSGDAAMRILGKVAMAQVEAKIGSHIYTKVPEIIARGLDALTVASESTVVTGRREANSTVGRVFKTSFEAGKPATRSVVQAGKQNGTSKITFYDSIVQTPTNDRDQLTLYSGFNQKALYWPRSVAHWSWNDLKTLINATGYVNETERAEAAYWLTKYFGTKLTIYNTNKYIKTKVKVHWLRQKEHNGGASTKMSSFFNSNIDFPTVKYTIPAEYQLTNNVVDTVFDHVMVDPVLGSMRQAERFPVTFDVVKTFTQTLDPGESWNIDYKHHTGPGIRINDLVNAVDDTAFNNEASFFYYPVIEFVGPTVECIDSDPPHLSYLGTAPGNLQVEFKKYFEAVLAPQGAETIYDGAGGYKSQYAIRVWKAPRTDNDTTIRRRFSIDSENILGAGGTPAIGKFVIPVVTDTQIQRAGQMTVAPTENPTPG